MHAPSTALSSPPSRLPLLPLLRREWLQHRFGWTLLAAVPLVLGLLATLFATVRIDADRPLPAEELPLVTALLTMTATTMTLFIVGTVASVFFVAGLARRDHGDRSIEFWLSLPTSHRAALGVPLLTHLLLVPAAAIVIGWAGGLLLSLVAVGRLAGLSGWLGLPWPQLFAASLALVARLLAGLPLALLWALPIVMLLVLMGAWFRRWGWIVLVVGVGLLSLLNQLTTGRRWLLETAGELLRQAGRALLGAGGEGLRIERGGSGFQALSELPSLAWRDFLAALAALPSPLLLGGLVFAAGCFALLLHWRERGAGLRD